MCNTSSLDVCGCNPANDCCTQPLGRWKWIGTCSCLGQDGDCKDDDSNWERVGYDDTPLDPDADYEPNWGTDEED